MRAAPGHAASERILAAILPISMGLTINNHPKDDKLYTIANREDLTAILTRKINWLIFGCPFTKKGKPRFSLLC